MEAFLDKVRDNGEEMVSIQVWEDTSPTWTTDYKVTAVATAGLTAASGVVAQGVQWFLVIGAVLLILFLIALTFVIRQINRLWYGESNGNGGGGISGIGEIIPLMIVVMMMAIIMPMMGSAIGGK